MMTRAFVLAVSGALLMLSPPLSAPSWAAEAPAAKAPSGKAAPKADPIPGPPLVAANPEAATSLVAFIDYEDPGAQMLREKLDAFAKSNKDIKLVVKPWASGGPLSRLSAKAAYAAERQGKFRELHEAMLKDQGSHTYFSIRDLCNVVGLEWDSLAADLDDPKVGEAVDANDKQAAGLKLTNGPAFVAGPHVFSEPWNKLDFTAIAKEARSAGGSAPAR